ncbi:MAG: HEAT repeat domain-containing protein [Deltaproteobacteria bacterium]|nr:HEAT repeat domain-containing protein [Deltaproteobacteria bacterium]
MSVCARQWLAIVVAGAVLVGGCGTASVEVSTAKPVAEPVTDPGELARLRAEQAAADGKWNGAASEFEEAYQLLDDPQMLFEAALAFTKAEQWSAAIDKLETYLVADRKQIDAQRAYAVDAEVDRLRTIVAGEEPVTWRSLADQVYGERRGETQPVEQPSAQEEQLLEEAVSEETASMYEQVPVEPAPAGLTAPPHERSAPTLQELLFYSGSKSSAVRLRAVRDLAAHPDDRARQALERGAQSDTNIRVRIAAIEGLVARGSVASIPLLKQIVLTASTSQERAVLKSAIAELLSRKGY